MDFLRQIAKQAATKFKDTADEVWDELGDSHGVSKEHGASAGKYALTAQLLMAMNFPDDAEVFRDTFNITNTGPTGAQGFKGTGVEAALNAVAAISMHRNSAAIGTQGYGDVTKTSSLDDLVDLLPVIRELPKEKK